MRRHTALSLITATALISGCNSADSADVATTATETPSTVAPTTGTTTSTTASTSATSTSTTAATTDTSGAPELTTGKAVVGYALSALSSATPATATALALNDEQSAEFPGCSENGSPWDATTNTRMQASDPEFGKRTFECQLKAHRSPESVRGSFEQNYKILCQLEKSIGAEIEFSDAGKSYQLNIALSADCGWDASTIEEVNGQTGGAGFEGTVVATSFKTGDWQKSISLNAEGIANFTMFMSNKDGVISFKSVDHWTQHERDGGDQNLSLPADAEGYKGGIVSLDVKNGILRAEIGDPYWGRRARMYVKGKLDKTTGAFTEVTEGSGLQGNFDISNYQNQKGLYGEVASVKGSAAGGFMFRNLQYGCDAQSAGCDVEATVRTKATISHAGEACDPSGACAAETGIALGVTAADYDFWMIGAAFDAQGGHSAAWTTWLQGAGVLKFDVADMKPVLD